MLSESTTLSTTASPLDFCILRPLPQRDLPRLAKPAPLFNFIWYIVLLPSSLRCINTWVGFPGYRCVSIRTHSPRSPSFSVHVSFSLQESDQVQRHANDCRTFSPRSPLFRDCLHFLMLRQPEKSNIGKQEFVLVLLQPP